MLRIWKATERQRLVPVEMETAFPFLLEPDHVVSVSYTHLTLPTT